MIASLNKTYLTVCVWVVGNNFEFIIKTHAVYLNNKDEYVLMV